jgi:hypothetical protein
MSLSKKVTGVNEPGTRTKMAFFGDVIETEIVLTIWVVGEGREIFKNYEGGEEKNLVGGRSSTLFIDRSILADY